MSCVIYKLAHGVIFLVCNEFFTIGKSISKLLHDFVVVVDLVFKKLIKWSMGVEMSSVMENFKQWCMLPNMHRTIDDTHIII
jgi:hypothetical protein